MGESSGEEAEGEGDAEREPQDGRGGGEVRVDVPIEGGDANHGFIHFLTELMYP